MTTMIGPLERATQVARDRPAVTCGGLELTYAQTWERCRRLVGALRAMGVERGDRVAIVGPNCHRYLELYQALPGAGIVVVPLNQRHTSAELGYALDDCDARVLFAGRPVEDLPACVEHVIDLDEGYEALIADARPADFPSDLPDDALAGLFYTGGTTGASKGVMLTHRNLVANALHFQVCWPFRTDTTWLIAAPLFHAAGSVAVLATVWNGGRQVVLPAFDAAGALDLVEAERRHRHPRRPDDAGGAERGADRPTSGRRLAPGHRPRWLAHRHRDAAAGARWPSPTPSCSTSTEPPRRRRSPPSSSGEERMLDAPQARSCGQPAVGVEIVVAGDDGSRLLAGRGRRGASSGART